MNHLHRRDAGLRPVASSSHRSSVGRRGLRVRRLRIEGLEDRRLLAAILYVNDDATGLNTGANWTDAFPDLQAALNAAAVLSGDEIWVAAGVYKPTAGVDRNISFRLKQGVSLYGGFAGNESARDQRNWTTNVTTLSGDIGTAGVNADNSYHVVLAWGPAEGVTVDGFTITQGNAESSSGGGMSNSYYSSPTLSNIVFSGNTAATGGGLYNDAYHSSPILNNVTFSNNSATSGGGMFNGSGLLSGGTSPAVLTNVTFVGNTATDYGGGLYNTNSAPLLTNVTLSNNSARLGGGIYNGYRSVPGLTNVIFQNNTAADFGGGMYNAGSSSPTLMNVTFSGNGASSGGGIANSAAPLISVTITNGIFWGNTGGLNPQIDDDPSSPATVAYSIIQGGWSGTGNRDVDPLFVDAGLGNLHLKAGSPAVDSGTGSGAPSFDCDGNPRPFDGNGDSVASVDMGAYESQVVNQPPVADAGGPYTVVEGGSRILSGAGSYDSDGAVALYEWDLDYDGAIFNVDATGATPTFTAGSLRPGDARTVALRVADYARAVSPIATARVTAVHRAGPTACGVYDPTQSIFYLKRDNVEGFADLTFGFGDLNWVPLAGDWDGDGLDTIGLFQPQAAHFYLRNSNTSGLADVNFGYGDPAHGDQYVLVMGDWNGDGIDTIGLYDKASAVWFLRNTNTEGVADVALGFGVPGSNWTPLVGDWNGDGVDTIGLYDPATSMFYLRNSQTTGMAEIAFPYGAIGAGWTPLIGDWDGDGAESAGFYQPGIASHFYLRNQFTAGPADVHFGLGFAGVQPIVGYWHGLNPANLLAADGAASAAADSALLSQASIQPIVEAALARWSAADISASALQAMSQTQVRIVDLPGACLGRAENGQIYLDRDAAGYGWFVDPTPAIDEEFAQLDAAGPFLAIDTRAADKIDLLTVVEHELGHVVGLTDLDAPTTSLMSGSLPSGNRRMATVQAVDAVLAGYRSLENAGRTS